jgi:DNA-binding transcriptional ArsR family regulator
LCVHFPDGSIRIVDEKPPVSTPLPLFRSDAQFRLLGELFTMPGLEVTVGTLAERVGVPRATVSREVARLAEAGLVSTRREGNRTVVRADDRSPVATDLRSLLSKLYGPVAAIRAELARVGGVEQAFIFGSWAARWRGEPGPPPEDVDVLVVGDVDRDEVWTRMAQLSRRLGVEVNPVIRLPEEWATDPTGFAATVKASPQVDVTPAGEAAA